MDAALESFNYLTGLVEIRSGKAGVGSVSCGSSEGSSVQVHLLTGYVCIRDNRGEYHLPSVVPGGGFTQ